MLHKSYKVGKFEVFMSKNFDVLKLKDSFESYLKENPIKIQGSFHPFYEKALNEMVLAGGKRFRPLLLLSVVSAFDSDKLQDAFKVAQAVEIMHTYSLIHDDLPVMDNADLRRGYPTLHKTYDELTATLVGDGLNTHTFKLISESNFNGDVRINLVGELAYNSGINGMVLGQIIDCYYDLGDGNGKKLSLDEIKFLHENKTGKMIAGSLKMGGIICEVGSKIEEELYTFGLKLGLLFQIQDDIFDVTLSSEDMQKTTNKDENKNTFVTLLGVEGSIEECDKIVLDLEAGLAQFDSNLQEHLRELLDKYIYRHRKISKEV